MMALLSRQRSRHDGDEMAQRCCSRRGTPCRRRRACCRRHRGRGRGRQWLRALTVRRHCTRGESTRHGSSVRATQGLDEQHAVEAEEALCAPGHPLCLLPPPTRSPAPPRPQAAYTPPPSQPQPAPLIHPPRRRLVAPEPSSASPPLPCSSRIYSMPALCRSAAAYDSLPRGARGPNAAVHRLRVSSGAAFRDSEEFGSPSGSTAALVAAAKDNAPSGRRRRTHSAAPGGAAAALLSPRSRRARKDVQLPLASSGPSDGWDSSASDERDAEAQLLRGVSSAPSSPVKGAAPHSRSIGAPLSPRSQERGAARGIGSPGSPVPARKRIVDKRVIGLPTNFQVSALLWQCMCTATLTPIH
jgi:hypothetical protein